MKFGFAQQLSYASGLFLPYFHPALTAVMCVCVSQSCLSADAIYTPINQSGPLTVSSPGKHQLRTLLAGAAGQPEGVRRS